MRYAIVIEPTATGFSAYALDVPGCVAAAATVGAAQLELRDALAFHMQGLREDGLDVPQPIAMVKYVNVAA